MSQPGRAPLEVDALRAALRPRFARVEVLPECPSTNVALLSALVDDGWGDFSLLVTEHQVAGLGRLGRSWVTRDRAALTFSVGLTPVGVPPTAWGWLPLLTGLVVAQSVRAVTGLPAGVKWPNDVLLPAPHPDETGSHADMTDQPRKVAGILATGQPAGSSVEAAVVGIGLNVSQTQAELPVPEATSLALAGASSINRTDLLTDLALRFHDAVTRWRRAGGDAVGCGLAEQISDHMHTIGKAVRVDLPARADQPGDQPSLSGVAQGLDDQGRLVVITADGRSQAVAAGDVHHVRPA